MKKESKRTKLDKKLKTFLEIELNFFVKKKGHFFWKYVSNLSKITKIVFLPMWKINVFFLGTLIMCYLQQRFATKFIFDALIMFSQFCLKASSMQLHLHKPHNSSDKDYFAPLKSCATLGESAKMKIGLFL